MTFEQAARLYGWDFDNLQVAGANIRRAINWRIILNTKGSGTPEEYEDCFTRAVASEHFQEPMPDMPEPSGKHPAVKK